MAKKTRKEAVKCKVRILCPLLGVYPKYQPEVGGIYEADFKKTKIGRTGQMIAPVCAIKILDKYICLRKGEYEILDGV